MQRLRLKDVEEDDLVLLNAKRDDSRRVACPAPPDGVILINILWDTIPKSIDIDQRTRKKVFYFVLYKACSAFSQDSLGGCFLTQQDRAIVDQ